MAAVPVSGASASARPDAGKTRAVTVLGSGGADFAVHCLCGVLHLEHQFSALSTFKLFSCLQRSQILMTSAAAEVLPVLRSFAVSAVPGAGATVSDAGAAVPGAGATASGAGPVVPGAGAVHPLTLLRCVVKPRELPNHLPHTQTKRLLGSTAEFLAALWGVLAVLVILPRAAGDAPVLAMAVDAARAVRGDVGGWRLIARRPDVVPVLVGVPVGASALTIS